MSEDWDRIDQQIDALLDDYFRYTERVLRFAREECPAGSCPVESVLNECVKRSVSKLIGPDAIRIHVPILALREVHDCINLGHCESAGAVL